MEHPDPAILLFGKTNAAIRFAGVLIVGFAVFIISRTTQQISTVQAGQLASVLTVLPLSVLPSRQVVISEHIIALPIAITLFLLVKPISKARRNDYNCASSGLLLSPAAMIRINAAYTAVGVFFYLLIIGIKQPLSQQIMRSIANDTGGSIPSFLNFLPY